MKTLFKSTFLLTTASIMLNLYVAYAQAPAILWQKSFGGALDENANCIQQTNDGGYVFAGDNGDYWIVKIDTAGNIQWQKSFGGSGADKAKSIRQTTDGGFIVAGETYSSDGDVTGNHGSLDYWIIKLNDFGNLQWEKCFGGTDLDHVTSIEHTKDGGYIVAGFSWSGDGDVTGHHGTYGYDFWIVKLGINGNIQWQKSLGGSDHDYAYSIDQTLDGGYIVAGNTNSTDGDVTGNHGGADYWIVKLGATGNIQWQNCFGGSNNEEPNYIEQTMDAGFIVAGYSGSNDGDVSGNHGRDDCWILKLDSTGIIQWQKTYGSTYWDYASCIHQTNDGKYIATGAEEAGDGDITGHHGYKGTKDFWVIRLDDSGSLLWQKSLGGTNHDWASSIVKTNTGGYIVAGSSASVDGDVTGNHGRIDAWIVKLERDCNLPTKPGSIFSFGGTAKVGPGESRIYFTKADTAVTFHWTVPAGASITKGQGTRKITVIYHHNFACSGGISVVKNNTCGSSDPRNETVYRKAPNRPSKIAGAHSGLCGKQNVVYSVQSESGITYDWTVPVVANIVSGQGTNSITVTFQSVDFINLISVTASKCGTSLPQVLIVYSAPATPLNIYGNTTVCSNSNGHAYWIAPVESASDYTWRAPYGSYITANGITSTNNVLTTTSNTVTVHFGTVTMLSTIGVRANNNCANGAPRFLLLLPCSQRAEILTSNEDINIFPNPSDGLFSISINSSSDSRYNILVHDILGKELMKENLSVHKGLTEHQINLQQLNPGLYFLTLTSSETKQVIKITRE